MSRLMWVLALVSGLVFAQPSADTVYEQGKALYDAKNFDGALEKFDACIALEPTKARWHYNRGLALKKLKRDDEARSALLESRRLEPDYKVHEIDEKLAELGGPAAPASSETTADSKLEWQPIVFGLAILAFIFGTLGSIIWRVIKFVMRAFVTTEKVVDHVRSTRANSRPPKTIENPPAQLTLAQQKLAEAAQALSRVEHGLSLGEDPTVRGHADRAATNLASARRDLEGARRNERPIADGLSALERAGEATTLAQQRLVELHGPSVLSARGPRAGCFFCARPLPTPAAGAAVSLKSGGADVTVAACQVCARRVATGQPAPVLMVGDQHWSEIDDFDPYVRAHAPGERVVEALAWKVLGGGDRDVSSLAAFAGGAVLGGLGAVAVGRLLDLDALKESGLASEAATAAARAASGSRSTGFTDHS